MSLNCGNLHVINWPLNFSAQARCMQDTRDIICLWLLPKIIIDTLALIHCFIDTSCKARQWNITYIITIRSFYWSLSPGEGRSGGPAFSPRSRHLLVSISTCYRINLCVTQSSCGYKEGKTFTLSRKSRKFLLTNILTAYFGNIWAKIGIPEWVCLAYGSQP